MSNLNCKKPKPCTPPEPTKPQPCSPAFDVCINDHTLKWDGFCLSLDRTRHTPDGTYTSVTVVNGCIVGYGYANEPTYTPPYCNPNPASCQGQPTATDHTISPNRDNSLVQSSSGLFARTFIQGHGNIKVSGTGTVANPYTISFTGTAGSTTVVAEAGLTHREGDGVVYLGMAKTGVNAGIYNGFSINEYGQIIGFSDTIVNGEISVGAGAGLVAFKKDEQTIIAHEEREVAGAYVFGGYSVGVDSTGHITALERITNLTAGTYSIGAYKIALNEYGGIQSITQGDVPDSAGTFNTSDGKIISYDETGRITDVNAIGSTPTATAPQAIRDMYRFTVTTTQVKKEAYGTDTSITNITDKSFDVQLPSYVVSTLQVQVNGALSHTLNGNILTITHTGMVTVIHPDAKIITLTLRA